MNDTERTEEDKMIPSKEEILIALRKRRKEISKAEVLNALSNDSKRTSTKYTFISFAAYSIGALILILGIVLLGIEFWETIPTAGKVLVTFGIGIVAFIPVTFLEMQKRHGQLSTALSLVSAILVPSGIAVIGFEVLDQVFNAEMQTLTALILILMFGSLYMVRQRSLFAFLLIIFSTWLVYAIVSLDIFDTVGTSVVFAFDSLYLYTTSIIGLSYLSCAYFMTTRRLHKNIVPLLYTAGSAFLTLPLFWLGGETAFWDIVALAAITTLLGGGILLERRSLFISGSALLAIFIILIAGRYFADTLGLPVTLMIAGTILMASGFGFFRFFKKTF